MSKVEEFAKEAWADYEYRESPQGLYSSCFIDGYKAGYEQAIKEVEEEVNYKIESHQKRFNTSIVTTLRVLLEFINSLKN